MSRLLPLNSNLLEKVFYRKSKSDYGSLNSLLALRWHLDLGTLGWWTEGTLIHFIWLVLILSSFKVSFIYKPIPAHKAALEFFHLTINLVSYFRKKGKTSSEHPSLSSIFFLSFTSSNPAARRWKQTSYGRQFINLVVHLDVPVSIRHPVRTSLLSPSAAPTVGGQEATYIGNQLQYLE